MAYEIHLERRGPDAHRLPIALFRVAGHYICRLRSIIGGFNMV
jgi:hypothetical protein